MVVFRAGACTSTNPLSVELYREHMSAGEDEVSCSSHRAELSMSDEKACGLIDLNLRTMMDLVTFTGAGKLTVKSTHAWSDETEKSVPVMLHSR